MIVRKRTFKANLYPTGSENRRVLNLSGITSEYMPSYKYVVCENDGTITPFNYRTKREAEAKAKGGN